VIINQITAKAGLKNENGIMLSVCKRFVKIKASSHSLLGGFNLNLITIGRQEARHMKPLI